MFSRYNINMWRGELRVEIFLQISTSCCFGRMCPIRYVKAEPVVPHILLVLHICGWDVEVFNIVYRCSSCGVAVLSVLLGTGGRCMYTLFPTSLKQCPTQNVTYLKNYSLMCNIIQAVRYSVSYSCTLEESLQKCCYLSEIQGYETCLLYLVMKTLQDCRWIETDIKAAPNWLSKNYMDLRVLVIFSFLVRLNTIHCNYQNNVVWIWYRTCEKFRCPIGE
jgi:hypothetical protein